MAYSLLKPIIIVSLISYFAVLVNSASYRFGPVILNLEKPLQETVDTIASSVDAETTVGTTVAQNDTTTEKPPHHYYKVASVDWAQVQNPFLISVWLLFALAAKTAFQYSEHLASLVPDSTLLLGLGLLLGLVLNFIGIDDSTATKMFTDSFFLYILPPIVFDAGYFMPNRSFFDNLGTILVYAIIGTLWNTLAIGFSLWGCGMQNIYKYDTPLLDVLTFSVIISAVDPVAVLVVFEEIHVNAILYITVFGESLLNDAVAVVLYDMFDAFAEMDTITALDVVLGVASFFVVSLGGVAIGVIYALICSFCSRLTQNVRIVEPLLILLMGYLSYLTAQLFHFSGILAIVFCGITMKQYVELNMSEDSKISVRYLLRMLCTISEAVIFMFLGITAISKDLVWDTAFILLAFLFCLVYRAIGTVVLTYFVNKTRIHKLAGEDQFIMAYGGLRGAIAYGLVSSLDEQHFVGKQVLVTATVFIICITVFVQGMTIKPLVNCLRVTKEEHQEAIDVFLFEKGIDDMISGIEVISGKRGQHWFRNKFDYINSQYIKPILVRDYQPISQDIYGRSDMFKQVYVDFNLRSALDTIQTHGYLKQDEYASNGILLPSGDDRRDSISPIADDENPDLNEATRAFIKEYLKRGRLSGALQSDYGGDTGIHSHRSSLAYRPEHQLKPRRRGSRYPYPRDPTRGRLATGEFNLDPDSLYGLSSTGNDDFSRELRRRSMMPGIHSPLVSALRLQDFKSKSPPVSPGHHAKGVHFTFNSETKPHYERHHGVATNPRHRDRRRTMGHVAFPTASDIVSAAQDVAWKVPASRHLPLAASSSVPVEKISVDGLEVPSHGGIGSSDVPEAFSAIQAYRRKSAAASELESIQEEATPGAHSHASGKTSDSVFVHDLIDEPKPDALNFFYGDDQMPRKPTGPTSTRSNSKSDKTANKTELYDLPRESLYNAQLYSINDSSRRSPALTVRTTPSNKPDRAPDTVDYRASMAGTSDLLLTVSDLERQSPKKTDTAKKDQKILKL